jgi:hypothetical protein
VPPRRRPALSALVFDLSVHVRRCRRTFVPGGGDEETRTPDPLLAKEMLCQLSYVPAEATLVVGDTGLEPVTSALSGQRSNQLS